MITVDPVDLSVLIVNYNVGRLVLDAAGSVAAQRFVGPEGRQGRLEILVIDNASHQADAAMLDRLPASVTVVRNSTNLGFAAANNQGMARAQGRYLCFLNPDTRLQEGSLQAMLDYLYQHPGVGMVGPRIWVDDEQVLQLPPGDPPSLAFLISRNLSEAYPRVRQWWEARWLREAVRFWQAEAPLEMTMLSGACLMAPRQVIERVGGFDSGFFLYYEDSDLCRRIRRLGLSLMMVPTAQIIHYYNQSGQADPEWVRSHALVSEGRFVRVHYGQPGVLLYRLANSISDGSASRGVRMRSPSPIGLGALSRPPCLILPKMDPAPCKELLWQIGMNPGCIPSAGAFLAGRELCLSQGMWERLMPGGYYLRAVDPETLRVLACWAWEKRR